MACWSLVRGWTHYDEKKSRTSCLVGVEKQKLQRRAWAGMAALSRKCREMSGPLCFGGS